MFFWWMPFLSVLHPIGAATDQRQHAKTKGISGRDKGGQPRPKAKTKRNAYGKAGRRKGAARKSARKARAKRRR
jgi:hypothetical protein